MTRIALSQFAFVVHTTASAEVVRVTIASRAPVADGAAFGATGPYERLSGTIEFAVDPANPHNTPIVDLASRHATPTAVCTSPRGCM
jgi:hypothetical protein